MKIEIREDAVMQLEKRHKLLIDMELKNVDDIPGYMALFTREDIKALQMLYRSAKSIDFIRKEIYTRMKRSEDKRDKYFGLSEALDVIDEIERCYIEDDE